MISWDDNMIHTEQHCIAANTVKAQKKENFTDFWTLWVKQDNRQKMMKQSASSSSEMFSTCSTVYALQLVSVFIFHIVVSETCLMGVSRIFVASMLIIFFATIT